MEKDLPHKVDTIQGNEPNVGIFAYTRTDEHGFLGQAKRLCVACSRAKPALYIRNKAMFSDEEKNICDGNFKASTEGALSLAKSLPAIFTNLYPQHWILLLRSPI
jgi:hypothetical protein